MKKCLLYGILCLLLSQNTFAQQPTVRTGSGEMKEKSWSIVNFTLFGANKDHLYAHSSNLTLLDKRWTRNYLTLFELDKEGNVTAKKELKSLGRKTSVKYAFLNGDSINLLINSHFRNSDENRLLHIRLSVNDLEKAQEITDLKTEEMDGDIFITSPDTSWIGCFKNLENDQWKITLYGRDFEEIYSKQMILQNIQSIYITNEAEIVLLGVRNNGNEIFFQILNEEQDKSFTADMDFKHIASIRIANYKNGRIYAGGLTYQWNDNKNTKLYNGCHSLMFDTKTEELKTDRISFTKRDIAILFNNIMPKKDADEEGVVNNLPMADRILSTENSTVFAYHYVPAILEENNFFQGGLFLFNIDDDGQIGWHHSIRRASNMANELFMVQYLFEYKGKPCIVYSAEASTALAENEEKLADMLKVFSQLSKSSTVMAMMNPDGTITKYLLDNVSNRLPYSTLEDQGERSFMMNRGHTIKFIFVK